MQNVTIKNSLYLLLGVSAIAWLLLAFIENKGLSNPLDFLGLLPKVVAIDLLLISVFAKWGVETKILRGWLVPFPDLNGTWTGYIYSDWVNPETGDKPRPIPVMLTVNQTFFHISCVMRTGEMESFSYAEGFQIDPDRQIKNLAFSYTCKPRLSLSNRSNQHDGAAVLRIIEKPHQKLSGRY